MFTRTNTIPPTKAGKNPRTTKPETKYAANLKIKALITNRKSPNVITVIGRVKIFTINPSVALMNPTTIAAINAVPNPLTSNPGIRYATITMLKALKNQLTIKITIPRASPIEGEQFGY